MLVRKDDDDDILLYDDDYDPSSIDINIHIDERHTPDPIGVSDWIVFGFAVGVMAFFLVMNVHLFLIRKTHVIVRSKNLPLLFLGSLASMVHISSVVLNEIFLLPHRNINPNDLHLFPDDEDGGGSSIATDDYDFTSSGSSSGSGPFGRNYDHVSSSSSNTIINAGSAALGQDGALWFLEIAGKWVVDQAHYVASEATSPGMVCVIMYFWLEFFFGLGTFLAILGLRLFVMMSATLRNVRLVVIQMHERRAIQFGFITLFLLPMYALCLFITSRDIAHLRIFHNDTDQSYNHKVEEDDAAFPHTDGTDTAATADTASAVIALCETNVIYKLILILILTIYAFSLLIMARYLEHTGMDMGHASATLFIVYLCIPVLFITSGLHFFHTLTYRWGRDTFVALVALLHLISYCRIALPGLCAVYSHINSTSSSSYASGGGYITSSSAVAAAMSSRFNIQDDATLLTRDLSDMSIRMSYMLKAGLDDFNQQNQQQSARQTLKIEELNTNYLLKKRFYNFCYDNGENLRWIPPLSTVVTLKKLAKNVATAERQRTTTRKGKRRSHATTTTTTAATAARKFAPERAPPGSSSSLGNSSNSSSSRSDGSGGGVTIIDYKSDDDSDDQDDFFIDDDEDADGLLVGGGGGDDHIPSPVEIQKMVLCLFSLDNIIKIIDEAKETAYRESEAARLRYYEDDISRSGGGGPGSSGGGVIDTRRSDGGQYARRRNNDKIGTAINPPPPLSTSTGTRWNKDGRPIMNNVGGGSGSSGSGLSMTAASAAPPPPPNPRMKKIDSLKAVLDEKLLVVDSLSSPPLFQDNTPQDEDLFELRNNSDDNGGGAWGGERKRRRRNVNSIESKSAVESLYNNDYTNSNDNGGGGESGGFFTSVFQCDAKRRSGGGCHCCSNSGSSSSSSICCCCCFSCFSLTCIMRKIRSLFTCGGRLLCLWKSVLCICCARFEKYARQRKRQRQNYLSTIDDGRNSSKSNRSFSSSSSGSSNNSIQMEPMRQRKRSDGDYHDDDDENGDYQTSALFHDNIDGTRNNDDNDQYYYYDDGGGASSSGGGGGTASFSDTTSENDDFGGSSFFSAARNPKRRRRNTANRNSGGGGGAGRFVSTDTAYAASGYTGGRGAGDCFLELEDDVVSGNSLMQESEIKHLLEMVNDMVTKFFVMPNAPPNVPQQYGQIPFSFLPATRKLVRQWDTINFSNFEDWDSSAPYNVRMWLQGILIDNFAIEFEKNLCGEEASKVLHYNDNGSSSSNVVGSSSAFGGGNAGGGGGIDCTTALGGNSSSSNNSSGSGAGGGGGGATASTVYYEGIQMLAELVRAGLLEEKDIQMLFSCVSTDPFLAQVFDDLPSNPITVTESLFESKDGISFTRSDPRQYGLDPDEFKMDFLTEEGEEEGSTSSRSGSSSSSDGGGEGRRRGGHYSSSSGNRNIRRGGGGARRRRRFYYVDDPMSVILTGPRQATRKKDGIVAHVFDISSKLASFIEERDNSISASLIGLLDDDYAINAIATTDEKNAAAAAVGGSSGTMGRDTLSMNPLLDLADGNAAIAKWFSDPESAPAVVRNPDTFCNFQISLWSCCGAFELSEKTINSFKIDGRVIQTQNKIKAFKKRNRKKRLKHLRKAAVGAAEITSSSSSSFSETEDEGEEEDGIKERRRGGGGISEGEDRFFDSNTMSENENELFAMSTSEMPIMLGSAMKKHLANNNNTSKRAEKRGSGGAGGASALSPPPLPSSNLGEEEEDEDDAAFDAILADYLQSANNEPHGPGIYKNGYILYSSFWEALFYFLIDTFAFLKSKAGKIFGTFMAFFCCHICHCRTQRSNSGDRTNSGNIILHTDELFSSPSPVAPTTTAGPPSSSLSNVGVAIDLTTVLSEEEDIVD